MSNIRVKITRSGTRKGQIVTMDMEEYLRGVVPSEIPASSPHAALCAQAIAARTYAAQKARGRASQAYDVDDTTANQAYHDGRSDPRTDKAIRDTAGQVLHYNGSILDTCVYSASNGGRTTSAKQRWGSERAYLPAKDDPYDKRAGYPKIGHGVGMSQRGAQQMAKEGCTCEQILAFYYPGAALQGSSVQAPTAKPTLRKGSRGEDVRALQMALGIKVDGIFGPDTEGAVRAYQIMHGLKGDGIVGPLTWKAMGVTA